MCKCFMGKKQISENKDPLNAMEMLSFLVDICSNPNFTTTTGNHNAGITRTNSSCTECYL